MKKNYSHKLILEIGLDLTNYLSPQNISGVKAYLGVDNDADVVAAIGEDKYRRVESLLISKGVNVISATMTNAQNEETVEPVVETSEPIEPEPFNESIETEDGNSEKIEDGTTQGEKVVLDLIKNAKDQIGDKGVITKIVLNKKYEDEINSVEMLKNVSELFEDTKVEFKTMNHEFIAEYMDSMGKTQNIVFD
ncbi:hypothetical protein AB9M75_04260 [Lactobacillus sp. AN1001]